MKKLVAALVLVLALILCAAAPALAEMREYTVLVYMCGSNLESVYGSASRDIEEMVASGFDSKKVTVLVLAGGSEKWQKGYDTEKLNIIEVTSRGTRVVGTQEARSMGDPATLTSFINFAYDKYSAKKYALILWDHGAGPINGVCSDELNGGDMLTINELWQALAGTKMRSGFEWIGFDACLMANAETALKIGSYARYMIASQETEPAGGWDYGFLKGIEKDESGAETGKRIIDMYFEANAEYESVITLACIDLDGDKLKAMRKGVNELFTPLGYGLGEESYAIAAASRYSTTSFGDLARSAGDESYDIVDLKELASRYSDTEPEAAKSLMEAVDDLVVYSRSGIKGANGLTIYHPFLNVSDYSGGWKDEFSGVAISPSYAEYVDRFATIMTGAPLTDWSGLCTETEGDEVVLKLTAQQAENCVSARLIILGSISGAGKEFNSEACMSVSTQPVEIGEDGVIHVKNDNRALYLYSDGEPVFGPVGFGASRDKRYVTLIYNMEADTGRGWEMVKYVFNETEPGADISCMPYVYDDDSGYFTNRIAINPEDYFSVEVYQNLKKMPEVSGTLPGFDDWVDSKWISGRIFPASMDWKIRFTDERLSGMEFYATIEITDIQGKTYCAQPVRLENTAVDEISALPASVRNGEFDVSLDVVYSDTVTEKVLRFDITANNCGAETADAAITGIIINGTRSVGIYSNDARALKEIEPGKSKTLSFTVDNRNLYGIDEITDIAVIFGNDFDNAAEFAITGVRTADFAGDYELLGNDFGSRTENGITVQLCGAIDEIGDSIVAGDTILFLKVANATDELFDKRFEGAALDGVMMPDMYGLIWTAPGTESYCVVRGGSISSRHRFGAVRTWRDMCLNPQRLSLMYSSNGGTGIEIELTDVPECLSGEAREGVTSSVIAEGDVTVSVDGIHADKYGTTLLMTAVNASDIGSSVETEITVVGKNGKTHTEEQYGYLSAGTARYIDIALFGFNNVRGGIDSVAYIDVIFRLTDAGQEAGGRIVLTTDCPVNPEHEVMLLPGNFEVEAQKFRELAPIEFTIESEIIAPENCGIEDFAIDFAVSASGERGYVYLYLDSALINGTRCLQVNGYAGVYYGGEHRSWTLRFDSEELTGITEINSVVLNFRAEIPGKTENIRFRHYCEVEPFALYGAPEEPAKALAAADYKGVRFELISYEFDQNDRMTLLFRYTNETDAFLKEYVDGITVREFLIHDIKDSALGKYFVCEPHSEGYFTRIVRSGGVRSFHVPAWFDKVGTIDEMTVITYGGGIMEFEFAEPLPLPETPNLDPMIPLELCDGEIGYTLEGIVVVKDGRVVAAGELTNGTEEDTGYKTYMTVFDDKGNSASDYYRNDVPAGKKAEADIFVTPDDNTVLENIAYVRIDIYGYRDYTVSESPLKTFEVYLNGICYYPPEQHQLIGADMYTVKTVQ